MANSMDMSFPQDICYVPYQGLSYGYCVKLTPEQLQQEKAMAAAKKKSQTTPSTTTSRRANDKRRNRTSFNNDQLLRLDREYKSNAYPDKERRAKIANDLFLEERIVKVWFTNRRTKDRKKSEKQSCSLKEFPVFPSYTPLTPASSRNSVSSSASETDFKLNKIAPYAGDITLLHKTKMETMSAKDGSRLQCNVNTGLYVPCDENYLAHYDSNYDHSNWAANQYAEYNNFQSTPNEPAMHYSQYDNFQIARGILSSDFKLIDKLTPDEITYLERTT